MSPESVCTCGHPMDRHDELDGPFGPEWRCVAEACDCPDFLRPMPLRRMLLASVAFWAAVLAAWAVLKGCGHGG